jgi:hypothetical protein
MQPINKLVMGGLLVGSLLGSSGCALLVALPAFGTAGYVAGREAGREKPKSDSAPAGGPVEHTASK